MANEGWTEAEAEYWDEEPYCWTCHNEGYVITCIDDLCRGSIGGEPGYRCIHGDGDVPCWDCDRAMYG